MLNYTCTPSTGVLFCPGSSLTSVRGATVRGFLFGELSMLTDEQLKARHREYQRQYLLRHPGIQRKLYQENKEYYRNYYKKNSEKMKKITTLCRFRNRMPSRLAQKRYKEKTNFGGLRYLVLERDNYSCVTCGMTNSEHIKRWEKSITIDHIDGFGSASDIKHNTMKNLQTLCLPCHSRKDTTRRYKLRTGKK